MEAQYREIPIGELAASSLNPRKHFDKKFIDELAENIADQGIIEPLVVREVERNGKPAHFEVIAGDRRLRAARQAKLERLPCIIRVLTDADALGMMLSENMQRAELTALEEAAALRLYMETASLTVEQVAEKIGKGIGYIYARLKLADLIGDAKKLLRDGTMGPGHAILLARLTPDVQARVLEACTEGEFWVETDGAPEKRFPTVRELEAILANDFYLDLDKAPFSKKDPGLLPAAGACVACPKRSGTNQALFADIKEPHVCTDPKCFQAKIDAHLEEKFQKLKLDSDGKEPVKLKRDSLWREVRAADTKETTCDRSVPGFATEMFLHGGKDFAPGDVEQMRLDALKTAAMPVIVAAAEKTKGIMRLAFEARLLEDPWALREEFKRRGLGRATAATVQKRLKTLSDAQLGAFAVASARVYVMDQLKETAALVGVDLKSIAIEPMTIESPDSARLRKKQLAASKSKKTGKRKKAK